MASYYFQFLTVFILFLAGIKEGLSASANDGNLKQMIDMGTLLNRLDRLETKVDQLTKQNSELLEERNRQQLNLVGFLPRSCFEVKAKNLSAQSGVYFIDPNGQLGGDQPIQVHCDMKTQTTSIYHDSETRTDVTSCPDAGCYTKAITYSATMRQMLNLAHISAFCKQLIMFDSFVVPLEYNYEQYGYWNDRNGGKQIFWAGPATSEHTCQCGIEKNCIETTFKCNTDSLAPIDLVDKGFITATELLPVTRLSFGRTSLTGVKASYTLGRLECTGQAVTPSRPTNCEDLFKMGHTLSGFYDVKSSRSQISSAYCDFTKASSDPGYETRYGFVDVKSEPVHFFVTRNSEWSTVGTMPFENEYLNLGGGMDLASGVFTAPKVGIYAFTFKGLAAGTYSTYAGSGDVQLQRNGVDVARGFSALFNATSGTETTLSVHGTWKLNKGDTITIYHYGGKIYSYNNDIQFTGSLIEEDLDIS